MRFRNVMVSAAVAVAVLLSAGCRRKEEDPEALPPEEEVAEVSEDYEEIPGTEPQAYISLSPATVGDYLDYLEDAGLETPERFAMEDADTDSPLRDVKRGEAERFAAWELRRLPTEDEWAEVHDLLDEKPYPWDGPDPRTGAEIHLVRDWEEGTSAEEDARQRKRRMVEERSNELAEENRDLYEKNTALIAEKKEQVNRQWQELQSELFSKVEEQKQRAEDENLIKGGRELSEKILSKLQEKKLPLRTMKLDEEFDEQEFEEQLSDYKESLSEMRNHSQELKTEIVDTNSDLSEKTRELKRRIRQAGEQQEEKLAEMADELQEPPSEYPGIEDALEEKNRLGQTRERASSLAAEFEGIIESLKENVLPILYLEPDEELEVELAGVREKIEERENTLMKWGEALDEEFEQLPHLIGDLRELKRIRARREALKHELEMLESIVEQKQ